MNSVKEIIVGTKEKDREIQKLKKMDLIVKIAPRLYSTVKNEPVETVVKRNWYHILSELYPDALLSHRSAFEKIPTPNGHIYLTYSYKENVVLPGLHIHLLNGPAATFGDDIFFNRTKVSGTVRAYLENLQQSRNTGEVSKCLTREQLEVRLENFISVKGEEALNSLRDNAKQIAPLLNMQKEFALLNSLISDMLGTGFSKNLVSAVAKARIIGAPLDIHRVEQFESLYADLAAQEFPDYNDKNLSSQAYKNFAFFECYFSNFIEGTEFTVQEAKQIITSLIPLPARGEDSHDVLRTYQIVSNKEEMSVNPTDENHFIHLLKERHAILLNARKSKNPGQFKDKNNRAGNTEFVDWQLVSGTLKKGFEWYTLLQHPFAKAAYMMFLVTEVHPFLDGNGRMARVMMNVELNSKGLAKIIIPTVYREDYMLSLKKLSKTKESDAYVRMLLKAWEFSSTIIQENLEDMENYLISCNAFYLPSEDQYLKYSVS